MHPGGAAGPAAGHAPAWQWSANSARGGGHPGRIHSLVHVETDDISLLSISPPAAWCSAARRPGGYGYSYQLAAPANGIYACEVPAGYTYIGAVSQYNDCSSTGFADSYEIEMPYNGMWACTVPAGYTYIGTMNTFNSCYRGAFGTRYELEAE